MVKVKIRNVFKLKGGVPFKKGDVVELIEEQVEAILDKLGEGYIEVLEVVEKEETPDFEGMNVPDLEKWLKDNEIEFDAKAKKEEKVKLAQEKTKDLAEQEENAKE